LCPSSVYGCWLPLWYIQTLLKVWESNLERERVTFQFHASASSMLLLYKVYIPNDVFSCTVKCKFWNKKTNALLTYQTYFSRIWYYTIKLLFNIWVISIRKPKKDTNTMTIISIGILYRCLFTDHLCRLVRLVPHLNWNILIRFIF
jgi:hypothetical protein